MIRVSRNISLTGERVVTIEGHATGDDLPEVTAAINAGGPGCIIDAAGLKSVDAAAREFLAGLKRKGTAIRGASMYVRALIEEPQQ